MSEVRNILAAAGAALTALGVGLVVLAQTHETTNQTEGNFGWALVSLGLLLLVMALIWSIRVATKRAPQPFLEIECGNDGSFRVSRPPSPRHAQAGVGEPIARVYQTRLLIREKNKVKAPSVMIQVDRTDPPPDPAAEENLPATLRWTTELWSRDFTPGDRFNVILCELVEYEDSCIPSFVHGHVPHVKRGETVTIEVQTFVNLGPNTRCTLEVSWPKDANYPDVRRLESPGGMQ